MEITIDDFDSACELIKTADIYLNHRGYRIEVLKSTTAKTSNTYFCNIYVKRLVYAEFNVNGMPKKHEIIIWDISNTVMPESTSVDEALTSALYRVRHHIHPDEMY